MYNSLIQHLLNMAQRAYKHRHTASMVQTEQSRPIKLLNIAHYILPLLPPYPPYPLLLQIFSILQRRLPTEYAFRLELMTSACSHTRSAAAALGTNILPQLNRLRENIVSLVP